MAHSGTYPTIMSQPMYATPVVVMNPNEGNVQPKREWNFGLFDCMANLGNCACGYCCPVCQMYSNVNRLGGDGASYVMLLCFLGMPMSIAMRSLARERLNIEGSYDRDVVAGICCSPCVGCQVANEIDEAERTGRI